MSQWQTGHHSRLQISPPQAKASPTTDDEHERASGDERKPALTSRLSGIGTG